jgi:hypothetical protein
MANAYDQLVKYKKSIEENIANNYTFVNFIPDTNTYNKKDNSQCFINSQNLISGTPLNMQPISTNLYTPNECLLHAGLMQNELNSSTTTTAAVVSSAGLNYQVVKGYCDNNPSYFLTATGDTKNNSVPNTGISSDFSSIQTATNNYVITNNWQYNYSVIWTGYFLPNVTGNWIFQIDSDDMSALWVADGRPTSWNGQLGANTMDNATVSDPNLHPMVKSISPAIKLNAGKYYPIVIIFGQNYGQHNFILTITDPNGKIYNGGCKDDKGNITNLFFTQTDNAKAITPTAYFALQENSPEDTANNRFKCLYATNVDTVTNNALTNYSNINTKTELIWAPLSMGNGSTYNNTQIDHLYYYLELFFHIQNEMRLTPMTLYIML